MKKKTDLLGTIRESIQSMVKDAQRAYNKARDPEFLTNYWKGFLVHLINNDQVTIRDVDDKAEMIKTVETASTEELKNSIPINWLCRNADTLRLKSGLQIRWFRFLFPAIPEKKEEYDKNPLNRWLRQTVHPNAEIFFGIEYPKPDRKKGSDKPKGATTKDEKGNVKVVSEAKPLINTLVRTVAYLVCSIPNLTPNKLDSIVSGYATQEKLDPKTQAMLKNALAETVTAEINIRKARTEKQVR